MITWDQLKWETINPGSKRCDLELLGVIIWWNTYPEGALHAGEHMLFEINASWHPKGNSTRYFRTQLDAAMFLMSLQYTPEGKR